MGLFLLAIAIIVAIESIILLVSWCDDVTKEISNKVLVSWCDDDDIIKEISNKDKKQMEQTVYKIEKGDLVGDIKGDNIIVILMNGDVNGDISSKEGNVVLIKGVINGDVKANNVLHPYTDTSELHKAMINKLTKFNEETASKENDKVRCSDCDFLRYNNDINGKYYCIQHHCTTSDALYKCSKFKPKPQDCINCEHYDFRNLLPTCNMGFSISFMHNVVFQHNPCNFFIKKQISDK